VDGSFASAALFEPVRAQMEQTDDRELAEVANPFLSWSIFDPRAAVARLEQVSSSRGLWTTAYSAAPKEAPRYNLAS
jgi:hypothetical protein